MKKKIVLISIFILLVISLFCIALSFILFSRYKHDLHEQESNIREEVAKAYKEYGNVCLAKGMHRKVDKSMPPSAQDFYKIERVYKGNVQRVNDVISVHITVDEPYERAIMLLSGEKDLVNSQAVIFFNININNKTAVSSNVGEEYIIYKSNDYVIYHKNNYQWDYCLDIVSHIK